MKTIGFFLLGILNIYQANAGYITYEKFNCKGIGEDENIITMTINFLNEDKTYIQTNLGSYIFTSDFEQTPLSFPQNGSIYKNSFNSTDASFEVELTKLVYRIDFIQGFINILKSNVEVEKVDLTCESKIHFQDIPSHCPGGPRCGPPYNSPHCHLTAAGCNP